MRFTLTLALVSGLALAATSTANAQWSRRGGVVMGPDGPLYDTRSPEWRMSGGNYFVYQELMQQKMELAQEKYMLQQMQQAAKLQQNQAKNKTKSKAKSQNQLDSSSPLTTQQGAGSSNDPFAEPVNHYSRHKKKPHTPSAAASHKTVKPKAETAKKTP
jgi:hypothetical protein